MDHWTGTLAYLDTPTAYNRIIETPQIILTRPLPLPLLSTDEDESPLGAITTVSIHGNELRAEGTARTGTLQPGQRLPVGIDLADVHVTLTEDHHYVFDSWRLMAATIYRTGHPAFPDTHIRLKDDHR
ncbi:hypothetical protein [Streptomyces sp. NPDC059278]|uniref:hypothetical protein n=1 Tax=Streptomyces sp. NPDC059278 TaxID=3346801 RepID=UPI003675BA79